MSKQGGVHVWEEEVLKVQPGECSWEMELGGGKMGKGGLGQKKSGCAILRASKR